jgi:hypothetical protein
MPTHAAAQHTGYKRGIVRSKKRQQRSLVERER